MDRDRVAAATMNVEAGQTIELVCLKGGIDAIRSRVPPAGATVIARTGVSRRRPVAGELFTLQVERSWVFGHTQYAKGLVTASRLALARLELEPLRLSPRGAWRPQDEAWLFEDGDDPIYGEIRAAGSRPVFEMEQVCPEQGIELRREEDAILEAIALAADGEIGEAEDLLGDLLTADLRCLDAHAHLGNFSFSDRWPGALDRASRHYGVGVAIGEQSLGGSFRGLLPWGLIDNRPYLRCLHGHGLCLWRAGEHAAASEVFRRLLWLNPSDNQGVRFVLAELEKGMPWAEDS